MRSGFRVHLEVALFIFVAEKAIFHQTTLEHKHDIYVCIIRRFSPWISTHHERHKLYEQKRLTNRTTELRSTQIWKQSSIKGTSAGTPATRTMLEVIQLEIVGSPNECNSTVPALTEDLNDFKRYVFDELCILREQVRLLTDKVAAKDGEISV